MEKREFDDILKEFKSVLKNFIENANTLPSVGGNATSSSSNQTNTDSISKLQEQIVKLNDYNQKLQNDYDEAVAAMNKTRSSTQKALLRNISRELEQQIEKQKESIKLLEQEIALTEEAAKAAEDKRKAEEEAESKKTPQQKYVEERKTSISTAKKAIENDFLLKKKNLKELDDLEVNLTKVRLEKEYRERERRLKLEDKTTDDLGRKRGNREWQEKKNRLKEEWQESSTGRKVGMVSSWVANGAAGAMNMINSGKMDVGSIGNKVSGALSNLGPYGAAAGGLVSIFTTLFEMYSKVDTAASKYSRTVGGSSITMKKMKAEAGRMATEFNKLGKRSYDAAEMIDTMGEYSVGLGRNLEYVSDASIKAMKDLKDYGIGMDVINMFDTLGFSVETISKKIGGIAGRAAGAGLNAKAVTDAMTKNLKLAQKYTFNQGMKSLEKMAQDSVSLKFNMQAAANFAEKVNTLEGAASVGAQLSVLGGNYAAFGNPLELLFGGLQGVDSLHEKMMQMTKDLAYFDEEKGMLDMSALDKQLLRIASQSMGVNYDDMANMAFNQYKDRKVEEGLSEYNNLTPEMKKYLRNIGQLNEKGEVEYKIGADKNGEGGKMINLKDLTEADLDALRKESNAKTNTQEQNVGEILGETRGIQEKLDDLVNAIKQKLVGGLMKLVDWFVKPEGSDDYTKSSLLTDEQIAQYGRIRDALDNTGLNSRQKSVNNLSDSDRKLMKELGMLNASGKLINEWAKDEWGQDVYHYQVFDTMNKHYTKVNEEAENNKEEKKETSASHAEGGFIVGPGTETSDSINAHLSNGEYVVKAKNVRGNLGLLNDINNGRINTGSNPYGFTDISKNTQTSNTLSGGNSNMSFEPLNININGSLDISANGYSQSINGKDILSQEMINKIIREIQIQTDYSFNRDKVHWKYQIT